ncbi:Cell wall synthesis protein KNH1 [Nakaseomyces bracarensis]|uniref:Cell wall synthesis protein KNH1 n=1 Tax=Nakaseomyces bracarensis TaxID=273131 RepID=A0ABR4NUR0_9SACH
MFFIWWLLIGLVKGDIAVVGPDLDESFDASGGFAQVNINWLYTPNAPLQEDFTKLTFSLCSGPNYNIEAFETLGTTSDINSLTYSVKIPNTIGTDGYYYIQIFSQTKDGYTIHYSPRFQLTGMDGAKVADTIMYTAPPTPETRVTTGDVGATIDSRSFTVPYAKQTGLVKYAPMQTQPATKISADTWTRKYDTSSVSYFTTNSQSPEQHTTLTPGWSYYISSDHNYAAAAPMPSNNGGWYDPKKRQSLTTRKINMSNLMKRRQ